MMTSTRFYQNPPSIYSCGKTFQLIQAENLIPVLLVKAGAGIRVPVIHSYTPLSGSTHPYLPTVLIIPVTELFRC